ncbi:plakophilin-3-like isoform X2 [Cyprinodon tularosa]|uniref:plakophilin-3-like isoform X2 n=1 Tax=Cyprinodon tularosa TaxID=77115 RepID=UPI0018E1EE77|nr:plakophilin-3-like isoform X2 [Cyprinodon tularosa]
MPHTPSTTYALPSDNQLGNGSTMADEQLRSRRVQEQVKMKLAEKSTLPRQNGAASHYAMSDYGGSSTMKYSTYSPSFSSKSSYMYSGSKTMAPQISHRAGYSSRSAAPEVVGFQKMSIGVSGGGGGGFHREDMRSGGFQASMRPHQMEHDAMSLHSVKNAPAVHSWVIESDAGSVQSDREATYSRQFNQGTMNGYSTQMRQGGGNVAYQSQFQAQAPAGVSMLRSQSGTLTRGGTMTGGGSEILQQQYSFKGPAHRTISRITNRNRMSVGSLSGTQMTNSAGNLMGGRDQVDRGFIVSTLGSGSQGNLLQRQGNLSRSMSIRSMQSVGRGMDVFGQMEDLDHLQGVTDLDIVTAIEYLRTDDPSLQTMGAAFVQHMCYNEKEAKDQVRQHGAIKDIVDLFNSENTEVARYATGAARNLIYENNDNKKTLIELNGIAALNEALKENDDELYKNITGILWNLSSKDKFKEIIAKETLTGLSEKILVPAAEREEQQKHESEDYTPNHTSSPSVDEIFTNTTGCLRNLSSGNEKTRQRMRETKGLVGSLVRCLRGSLDNGKSEEKGVENTMCILRNLSYQIYNELPPSYQMRLNRKVETDKSSGTVGCFSPNSKKPNKDCNRLIYQEITKEPKDMEWLWHPNIVTLYQGVLQSCEINATTREAAIGSLQNITSGEGQVGDLSSTNNREAKPFYLRIRNTLIIPEGNCCIAMKVCVCNPQWAAQLSVFAVEQRKILPKLMDLLRTDRNKELLSLTGLLRNLARHSNVSSTLDQVVNKLPTDGKMKDPSAEVVVNLCGILNSMVMKDFDATKRICENGGLERLMAVKKTTDSSPEGLRAAKSASTVLSNIYNYKKLHKNFKQMGLTKKDFELSNCT